MPLSRRSFLGSTAGALAAPPVGKAAPRKPNFLVILADDMGFSDAGCFGGDIATPNLDKLAAGGLRFTQMYSTARCGPSRNCLLTGYYAQQNACDVMTPGRIPSWTRLTPEYLKPQGYRAYHSGKWHIRFRPVAGAGFDESYCLMDQDRFFSPRRHLLNDEPLKPVERTDGYYATVAIADHAVRWLAGHARSHAADPFYLYLAFTSPHFPLHALQEDIDRYRDAFAGGWDEARRRRYERMRRMGLVNCALAPLEPAMRPAWNTADKDLLASIGPDEVTAAVPWDSLTAGQKKLQRMKMAIHAAMITRMDQEIGRVLAQLRQMNALDDTVIVFLSDNGASSEQLIRADGHDASAAPGSAASHLCLGPGWASCANAPFRLHKSWVHEGGISSPMIVHWPAGIAANQAGKLRHTPAHFVDVVPTLADLAGAPVASAGEGAPSMPGRSLKAAFAKDVVVDRPALYFHHSNNRALRVGDWKLVAAGQQSPWELYDLRRDRCEQRNLVERESARANRMAEQWQALDSGFIAARQGSAAESTKPRL